MTDATPTPRWPAWQRWLLIGGALSGLVIVLCCGAAVLGGFRLFQGLQAEQAAIQPTLRAFFEAGERHDAAAALDLFAAAAGADVSLDDLARLFDQRPEIFAGFSDVTVGSLQVTSGTWGTTGRVEGFVTYADEAPQRRYAAVLRKEGDAWKLVSIQFPEGVG